MDPDQIGMYASTKPPKLAKSLTFPRALSRQLRRLRRPRRRDYTLLPRLLLGLLHATHTARLPGWRALAPEVLHLGGEYRVPRDPGESPCRRGPARSGQQGLLLHQGEVVLLQQQVPEIYSPRRRERVHEDRLLPGLLGRDLRPLPTTPSHRELQEGFSTEVDGEIPDIQGLEEVRTVWEHSREDSGLQPHGVSIKKLPSPKQRKSR